MCLCVIYVVIINMHLTSGVNSVSHCFFLILAKKETAKEKQLKEEEKILESVAEKKGLYKPSASAGL